MKKALSIALALVMALSLCTVAFAGNEQLATPDQKASIPVQAKTSAGGDAGIVYSVDVTYGVMQFTYTTGDYVTWDPQTHEDTIVSAGNWFAQGNDIKVSNHSNADVKVAIVPDQGTVWPGAGTDSINVSITTDAAGSIPYSSTTLRNAETYAPGNYAGADYLTAFVQLSGAYSGNETFAPIGNIVVSFSAV